MRVLALASGKGGSGKSTTAVHLAVGLARQGRRVLLADLDPQGHATAWLLGLDDLPKAGTAEALLANKLGPEHLRQIEEPNLRGEKGGALELLPSTRALHTADLSLAPEPGGHVILREVLKDYRDGGWDFVILDCPAALGFYSLAALCAAHGVVAPVPPTFLALSGLRQLEERIALAAKRLGADARLLGYLLFAVDPRKAITGESRDLLRREAGDRLYRAEVRISTAAESLPAYRRTAWDQGADPRGAEDYPAVLAETIERLDAGAPARRGRGAHEEERHGQGKQVG
jgi:chromosome partitioning protein